jgi:hypothetical protein
MNDIEEKYNYPFTSYTVALEIVEYMNLRYPNMIYLIKEINNKYQIVYKKKIIIKI